MRIGDLIGLFSSPNEGCLSPNGGRSVRSSPGLVIEESNSFSGRSRTGPLVGPPGRLNDGRPIPKGGLLDDPGLGLEDGDLKPPATVTPASVGVGLFPGLLNPPPGLLIVVPRVPSGVTPGLISSVNPLASSLSTNNSVGLCLGFPLVLPVPNDCPEGLVGLTGRPRIGEEPPKLESSISNPLLSEVSSRLT